MKLILLQIDIFLKNLSEYLYQIFINLNIWWILIIQINFLFSLYLVTIIFNYSALLLWLFIKNKEERFHQWFKNFNMISKRSNQFNKFQQRETRVCSIPNAFISFLIALIFFWERFLVFGILMINMRQRMR